MKKQYSAPVLDVATLVTTEIIVTSTPRASQKEADSGTMYGNSYNPIWDENE
jgi:hypothetical protein